MDTQNQPLEYSQKQINDGQTYINYELVRVDERIIKIIAMLVDLLKQSRALPEAAPNSTASARLNTVASIESALNDAAGINGRVAGIKPPGCAPPPGYPGD
jgi:hypothetical protein